MDTLDDSFSLFIRTNTCVVIPSYNNGGTLNVVLDEVLKLTDQVIVVNDGSTDNTSAYVKKYSQISWISYKQNVGKGWALRQAFKLASDLGYDQIITMDADGQHFASDLVLFLEASQKYPGALIVGARNIQAEGMPAKNTFANKFSNFWFWVETGKSLPDTQSGFRLYPLSKMESMRFYTKKYEFELEVLVRADWRGIELVSIPVQVYYPPEDERVSHFRPFRDFFRISILNTVLVLLTFTLAWPMKLVRYLANNKFSAVVKEQLQKHNENHAKMAAAFGFGVFMGLVPIWGFQMLTAAFLAHLLRLNKVIVVAASNISLPPLIPFIVFFSFELGKLVVHEPVDFTSEMMYYLKDQVMQGNFYHSLNEFGYSIFQYILGSLLLASVAGLLVFLTSWVLLYIFGQKKRRKSL